MSDGIGVVAFENELNCIVQEYLDFCDYSRTSQAFEDECLVRGKKLEKLAERRKKQKALEIQVSWDILALVSMSFPLLDTVLATLQECVSVIELSEAFYIVTLLSSLTYQRFSGNDQLCASIIMIHSCGLKLQSIRSFCYLSIPMELLLMHVVN